MRARWIAGVILAGCAALLPARALAQVQPPAAASTERKLDLTFNNGRVTLIAKNVTLQEILAEWTRKGSCPFPGAEKIVGGKLPPLQYENQPELTVLQSLLRSLSGYIPFPRKVGNPGASMFEGVQVLASSKATTTMPMNSGMSMPIAAPLVPQGNPMDEIPPIVTVPNPNAQPQPASPNQPTVAPSQPGIYVQPAGRGATPPATGTTGTGRGGGGR